MLEVSFPLAAAAAAAELQLFLAVVDVDVVVVVVKRQVVVGCEETLLHLLPEEATPIEVALQCSLVGVAAERHQRLCAEAGLGERLQGTAPHRSHVELWMCDSDCSKHERHSLGETVAFRRWDEVLFAGLVRRLEVLMKIRVPLDWARRVDCVRPAKLHTLALIEVDRESTIRVKFHVASAELENAPGASSREPHDQQSRADLRSRFLGEGLCDLVRLDCWEVARLVLMRAQLVSCQ